MTYLAVPIAAKTLQEAEEQIQAAVAAGAELLELRTDYLVHLSVELALGDISRRRCSKQHGSDVGPYSDSVSIHAHGALHRERLTILVPEAFDARRVDAGLDSTLAGK